MTNDVSTKAVNMEDLQAYSRKLVNKGIINEGTCTTESANVAKTVTVGNTFDEVNKATVIVTFQNAISVVEDGQQNTLTLRVDKSVYNETTEQYDVTQGTAYPIKYKGANLGANLVGAGSTLTLRLVYDSVTPANSYWNVVGELLNTPPTYDAANKRITFPATSAFSYDSTNKRIIIAQ